MCLVSFTNRLNKFLAKRKKKIFHVCTKHRATERNEDTPLLLPPPSTHPPTHSGNLVTFIKSYNLKKNLRWGVFVAKGRQIRTNLADLVV